MSCHSDNCPSLTPSSCVTWSGDPIIGLGVCSTDTLTEVIESIYTLISNVETGDITLSGISYNCDFLSTQLIGKEKTLENLIQTSYDSLCSLNESVKLIEETISESYSYDVKCLSPSGDSTESILQATINKLCEIADEVTTLADEVENTSITTTINNYTGNKILTSINSCGDYGINKTGSGETAAIELYGFVPPHCPIPCFAPLSYFEANGAGKADTPFCGWYICNGLNGTVNMLGYGFSSATTLPGMGSTELDSRVNPNLDTTRQTFVGDKKGEIKHTLTANEMPSHSHTATADQHDHGVPSLIDNFVIAGGSTASGFSDGSSGNERTTSANLNISVSSSGEGQAHENRQPTIYGYYIIRL